MLAETTSFKSSVEDLALDALQGLEQQRTVLEQQLEAVAEEIRQVKGVLRAVAPKRKAEKKGAEKKAQQQPFKMSEQRWQQVSRWLAENEVEFTATMLQREMGWASSYASMAVKQLRELGVIRMVRRDGHSIYYRSLV